MTLRIDQEYTRSGVELVQVFGDPELFCALCLPVLGGRCGV